MAKVSYREVPKDSFLTDHKSTNRGKGTTENETLSTSGNTVFGKWWIFCGGSFAPAGQG